MSTPSTLLTSAGPGQQPPDSTFGAFLIGNFVGLFLYGVTLFQAYQYACTYPQDALWLKSVVVLSVIFETLSSVLAVHSCYVYLVMNHSLPLGEAFTTGLWSLNLYPLVLGLVIVTSQSFFIRRLWLLGSWPYKIGVAVSASCSLAVLGCCTAATAKTFIINDGAKSRPALADLISKAFLLALIADCLLTVMLIHVLHHFRSGVKSTNTMIDLLIIYSVRTGLLTGVFDLLTTAFAFARPGDNAYIAIGLPGARMYAITLLAALNSRQWIAARGSSADGSEILGSAMLSPVVFTSMRAGRSLQTRSVGLGATTRGDDGDAIELGIMSQRAHPNRISSPFEGLTKVDSAYPP